jgi:transposase InsO family protein
MAELCRAFQIEKIRTTSYKPSTNGAVERFHRTLNSMLGKVVEESQRDWDHRLYEVMAAYRSTVHQSTGFSPNFLVYGRENRAPIDLVLAVSDEPDGVGTSPDEFVNEMLDRKR